MASGFFALLDDIGALMDDVVVMSKITTKKTAGILGDDLAVNAEKATGFVSSRELPVLWAITKGSFLNKLIILPIAFLLSSFLPWARLALFVGIMCISIFPILVKMALTPGLISAFYRMLFSFLLLLPYVFFKRQLELPSFRLLSLHPILRWQS